MTDDLCSFQRGVGGLYEKNKALEVRKSTRHMFYEGNDGTDVACVDD